MAARYYGLLPEQADGPVELAERDRGGWRRVSEADVKGLSDDEAVFFAPGEAVARHAAAIPARNEREARRAAPFAVEDEVAGPVEAMHAALGPRAEDGQRSVYLVDDALMAAWTDRLAALGCRNAPIYADYDVLPDEPLALDLGDRILVSDGARRFAIDADMPDDLLRALTSRNGAPAPVVGAHLAHRLGREAVDPGAGDPLLTLVAFAEQTGAPLTSLRQGAYAAKRKGGGVDFSAWRRVGVMAAAAGLAWIASLALETRALERGADEMRAEAQAMYAAVFPEEGPVADPVRAARARAGELGEGAPAAMEFAPAMAVLYEAVSGVDGAFIRSVRFDRDSGQLRASVSYRAYGDDAALRDAIEAQGLNARIGDSRQDGSVVVGDITVGEVS